MKNYRDEALRRIEDGLIDAYALAQMAVCYMSQDDVRDMLDANELSERFFEEEH